MRQILVIIFASFVLAGCVCKQHAPAELQLDFFGIELGQEVEAFLDGLDTITELEYNRSHVVFDKYDYAIMPAVFQGDSAYLILHGKLVPTTEDQAERYVNFLEIMLYPECTSHFLWELYDRFVALYGEDYVQGTDTLKDGVSTAPYIYWKRSGGMIRIQSYPGSELLNIYIDYKLDDADI